ncbi:alpha/beta hydrolase [Roseobacter sp. HKCCA0434]|uniref:alpha/beta hydrolase n=1 Tax=Roseobacter sp. HKCCA0434 TaxID=3079297 RepID=UPI0029058B56|nr:alpha/beta hydrolase fold domain-containing protein [Roseobacter sp. HKCCA0434]
MKSPVGAEAERVIPVSRITDWDDAYANGAHIAGGDAFPGIWAKEAEGYRARMRAEGRMRTLRHGDDPRDELDLFMPEGPARGLALFVHGGYWKAFDRATWSHFAQGALAGGFATAVPSYPLAPEARIGAITRSIARAVAVAAQEVAGPIQLSGHSAGAHLVTRMAGRDSPLAADLRDRISNVLTISGVHDLRPLLHTRMAAELRLDAEEAARESPALDLPLDHVAVTVCVGAEERPEFLRQSRLLATLWGGAAERVTLHVVPERHHFDVIDILRDPDHPVMIDWLG